MDLMDLGRRASVHEDCGRKRTTSPSVTPTAARMERRISLAHARLGFLCQCMCLCTVAIKIENEMRKKNRENATYWPVHTAVMSRDRGPAK